MRYTTLAVTSICVIWSVSANADVSCQDYYTSPPAACSFSCVAGQPISVDGFTEAPSGTVSIRVAAFCDGVEIVNCSSIGHAATGCSATSTITPDRDGEGTCVVDGSFTQVGEFSCTTVTE